MSGAKDIANPYLGGFGFSRPKATDPYTTDTVARSQITLDYYHHPSKRSNPELRYLQAFDLYSYVRYPLLYLIILTHRRQHKSTNNIAPNSAASRQGIC